MPELAPCPPVLSGCTLASLPPAPVLHPPPQERNLCAAERYLPAQYLAIKAAVLKLQETRGRVPRGEMLKLSFQASGLGDA